MCMGCVCVYVCVGVYVLCVRHKNSTSLKPLIIAGQKIERETLLGTHLVSSCISDVYPGLRCIVPENSHCLAPARQAHIRIRDE